MYILQKLRKQKETTRKKTKYLSTQIFKYNSRSQEPAAANPREKERWIHENKKPCYSYTWYMAICLVNGTAVSQNHGNVCTVLGTSTFARHGYVRYLGICLVTIFTVTVIQYWRDCCAGGNRKTTVIHGITAFTTNRGFIADILSLTEDSPGNFAHVLYEPLSTR